jgi:hypothetical protein
VVHSIKEFLEIKINYDAVAFGNIGLRLCTPAGSTAMAFDGSGLRD